MASFRLLNQAPQYLLPDGSVNAGGKLFTYETDLSTPKATFSDPDLTVLNSNPVVMDAAGRTMTDVWGDGEYGVVMTDAAEVPQWTRNNVRPDAGAGTSIPPLQTGEFLTNDGSILQWQPILQVPDPTGFAGNWLTTDGVLAFWAALPTTPTPLITITATSVKLSTGVAAVMMQWGTDTVPASGTPISTKAFVFPTPFTALYHVDATINGGPGVANPGGGIPSGAVGGRSVAGASFNIDTNAFGSTVNVVNPVPFSWFAVGAVAP